MRQRPLTRSIASSCLVATQHVDDKTVLLHTMKFGGYGIEVYAVITVEPQICPTLSCLAPFDNSMTKLWHAATVELPAVKLNLVTPNNGFITGTSGGGLMPSVTTPERAFLRSVANPLIFLIRYYHNRAHEITRTTHVFPLSFIQSLVKDFRDTICHQEVAWNRWGPQNSRCFVDHSSVITGAYGSQILLSDGSMLDFNPQLISHELMRVGKSPLFKPRKRLLLGRSSKRDVELPEGGRIVRQPTVLRKGPVFEQDVVTCLPYRETRLEGVPSTSALVFGGEVWVACTAEVDDDGFTRHSCYTLSPR
ncbi:hypothetical protein BC629DRAFT_794333 [Irpex lacteus]|nr:hypothetical protein BC629DRAFT_794333 [Irpex lacteus]